MLQLEGISKRYKKREVLKEVSFELNPDGATALIGANGSGKTTLLQIIMGMIRPDAGEVHWLGEPLKRMHTYKRVQKGLGYMSQGSTAISDLTVRQNLALACHKEMNPDEILAEYDLEALAKQSVETLSAGELRRLEFCMAIATKPRMILLDEPFAGLDPKSIAAVLAYVKGCKEKAIGILIVDHRLEQVSQVAELMLLLHEGELVFEGSPAEFGHSETVRDLYTG